MEPFERDYMSLSFALIARDEEDCIGACLESLQDIADEIVVVDTGSVDKTKEIALKYTDKVFDFEWIDDFSAARNFSFEQCTGTHICWVDADDRALEGSKKALRELDLSDKDIVITNYVYCHDEYGNPSCIVPRERIIKRSLGLRWEQQIHEYIPVAGRNYYNSGINFPDHYRKHGTSERNLRILQNIVEKNPGDSRNVYYLGKEYQEAGMVDEAIPWLQEYVRRKDGFWEDIYNAYFRLAQCFMGRDDNQFKENIFESIKIEERRAEPYFLLGQLYEFKQDWLRAIQWYEMCLCAKRPKDLLSSYQPEYYTWLPLLQLCVCYNGLGDLQKAYDYNEMIFQYRPEDSRALNNRGILKQAIENHKIQQRKDGEGKRLNLGCGCKRMGGYVNVDLFDGEGVDEVFNLYEIPYQDGTIAAINSEHSLEHVGWLKADQALKEWYRVLQPGGELMLKLPDLEHCCRKYLETPYENKTHKQWYKYTIYGIQQSQAGEPDEAQTHLCGYSLREMREKLEETGFICDFGVNYNGWDTPSMAFRCLKPVSDLKVGWIAPVNWDAAQTRIRVLQINRWLRSRGYQSDVVNYPQIVNQNYDIAIVGKTFDENHFKNIRMLKQYGKTVYCDLCEQIIGFPFVNEILSICDRIICCSRKLEELVKPINPNTCVIEDAWET